jgi:segregation and condensation protein B
MNDQYVRNVIEAALLAAGRPLASDELINLFDERDGSNAEEVQTAIGTLRAEYEGRGLELVEVASGYRIQIRTSVAQPVSRLWQERPTKYSRALLETLALVAYRQPITRGEIEQIRGVAVNPNIIKTLHERGWIRMVGHRDVPGRPELLGTTREFLDYFSLQKLDDLPTLAQLKELDELRVQLSLPGADPIADGEFAPQDKVAAAELVDGAAVERAPSEVEGTAEAEAPEFEATEFEATEVEATGVEAALTEAVASGEERTEVEGAAEAAALDDEESEDDFVGDERAVPKVEAAAHDAPHEPTDAEGTEFGDEDEELDAADAQHRPHLVARGPEDDQY